MSVSGVCIKIILSKYQEENVVVRKSLSQFHCETDDLDFNKSLSSGQEFEAANVIDINRFKEKTNYPATLGRNEILLQGSMSTKHHDSARGIFIGKYKETQRSTVFMENYPTVEIKV